MKQFRGPTSSFRGIYHVQVLWFWGRTPGRRRPVDRLPGRSMFPYIALLLSAVDWLVLKLLVPVLEPFITSVQNKLKSNHVTGSLVVPLIADLRKGVENAQMELRQPLSLGATLDVLEAKAALLPYVEALVENLDKGLGDGSNLLTIGEGPRRQPKGFKKEQVMATALDPRCKILYGVRDKGKEGVWPALAEVAAEIAKSARAADDVATASSASASKPSTAPGIWINVNWVLRRNLCPSPTQEACSCFIQASQAQAAAATTTATPVPGDHLQQMARVEVDAYRKVAGLSIEDKQADGTIRYPDPLAPWRINHGNTLCSRCLSAIPASQAQS